MLNESLLGTMKLCFACDHAQNEFGIHGKMNFLNPPRQNQTKLHGRIKFLNPPRQNQNRLHGRKKILNSPRPNKFQQHGRLKNFILPCHKIKLPATKWNYMPRNGTSCHKIDFHAQIKTLLSK